MRRIVHPVISALLALLVLTACGGGPAPAAPATEVPAADQPAAAPAPVGGQRTFVIVPEQSKASYLVNEEFFGGALDKLGIAAGAFARAARLAAKEALQHPPQTFTQRQRTLVVGGFAAACAQSGYVVHACAVLADHVHLVIARHAREIRLIVGHFKGQATMAIKRDAKKDSDRPIWGDHGWNVFLDTPTAVRRAIRYVEENPIKERLPRQEWSFVTPYRS